MQSKDRRNLEYKLKLKHHIFFIILIVLTILLLIDFFTDGITHSIIYSDVNDLYNTFYTLGFLGPVVFVLLVAIEVMLAPIPGFIFYVTGAVLFGWIWGGVLTLVGNMIGSTFAFYLANCLGRDYVEKKMSEKKLHLFDKYADRFGGWAIFLLRINPFTSSDIFSYTAGLSKMPFKDFFLGTLLGLLPLSFAQTYFGENIIEASSQFYWLFLCISIVYFFATIYFIYITSKKKF